MDYCIRYIFRESNFSRIGTSRHFREWLNSRSRRAMDGKISIIHSFSEGKISDPVFKQKCYKLTKKPCVMLFHYYDEFLKILRDHSKEADIQSTSTSTTRAHTSIVLYTCSTTGNACLQLSCTVHANSHGRSRANSHRSAGVSLHDINTHDMRVLTFCRVKACCVTINFLQD